MKWVPINDGPPGSHLLQPPSAFMEFYLEIIELQNLQPRHLLFRFTLTALTAHSQQAAVLEGEKNALKPLLAAQQQTVDRQIVAGECNGAFSGKEHIFPS